MILGPSTTFNGLHQKNQVGSRNSNSHDNRLFCGEMVPLCPHRWSLALDVNLSYLLSPLDGALCLKEKTQFNIAAVQCASNPLLNTEHHLESSTNTTYASWSFIQSTSTKSYWKVWNFNFQRAWYYRLDWRENDPESFDHKLLLYLRTWLYLTDVNFKMILDSIITYLPWTIYLFFLHSDIQYITHKDRWNSVLSNENETLKFQQTWTKSSKRPVEGVGPSLNRVNLLTNRHQLFLKSFLKFRCIVYYYKIHFLHTIQEQ